MPKITPIEQTVIDRVVSGVKYIVSGVTPNTWFSPNQPLQPIAQEQAKGRKFDYPVANNLRITKRQGEGNYGVTYDDLRGLADTYDLVRIVIETKKDQLARKKWDIVYKDGRDPDKNLEAIKLKFKYPDNYHTHSQWIRMIVEDLLVVDATAIYPRLNRGGGIFSLDLIDPITINRMIDESGRTPLAPDVAYQQILKGVPAVDYSADELYYSNRNPRTGKIYGFSPVEQIIITVNTALRRQSSQLEYFTSGSVPDAIMEAPSEWSPENIKDFQNYFDSILSGQTSERRKVRMVPSGAKFTTIKQDLLKDEFDEWMAKIVCFAFSISPQALIKQMNKASAETSVDTAEEEGLLPMMEHLAHLHNYIIEKHFGLSDIEFKWTEEIATDSFIQAQIDQIYITNGVQTPKQIAIARGFEYEEPKTQQEDTAQKMEKQDPRAKMENLLEPHIKELEDKLGKQLAEIGRKQAKSVSAITKNDNDELDEEFLIISQLVGSSLLEVVNITVSIAMEEVGGSSISLKQANEKAIVWANERAAELVGKKIIDGEIVDNPNAKWNITKTTREAIKAEVTTASELGSTKKELETAIKNNHAFSQERASMIANTELVTAYNNGNLIAYNASGIKMKKRSILGNNENHGQDDILNAKQGAIPLNQAFQSGHQSPSYHPNCRCCLIPIIEEE